MRKFLFALLSSWALTLSAQPLPTPEDYVRTGVEALRLFAQENHSHAEAMAFLNEVIAPGFDFEYMTDYALGPMAGRLKASQREQMRRSIQEHFLTTLATMLAQRQRDLPAIEIRRSRPRGEREVVVDTLVSNQQQLQIPISFRFYRGDYGWRIFDVVALGNSAMMYYRQMLKRKIMNY